MRREIPDPIEYVISVMRLQDPNGGVAVGYIVTPRYEGDTDERFCGRQGSLDIRIDSSKVRLSDAYQHAQECFEAMKGIERLREQFDPQEEEPDDQDDDGVV